MHARISFRKRQQLPGGPFLSRGIKMRSSCRRRERPSRNPLAMVHFFFGRLRTPLSCCPLPALSRIFLRHGTAPEIALSCRPTLRRFNRLLPPAEEGTVKNLRVNPAIVTLQSRAEFIRKLFKKERGREGNRKATKRTFDE